MAKKKPKTTEELVQEEANFIREQRKRWLEILQSGCSDPFWADGVNMNLLRNHIIFAKRKLAELTAETGTQLPAEFFLETPPYIDENFFAVPTSERAIRIMSRSGWMCCNHEISASAKECRLFSKRAEQNQLSLF